MIKLTTMSLRGSMFERWGFDFLDLSQLIALPPETTVERAQALVAKGLICDPVACAGVFGTVRKPVCPLSQL